MKNKSKLFFFFLAIHIVFSCSQAPSCIEYCDKQIRKDKYKFCINKIYYEGRYLTLEGINSKGEKEKTNHIGLDEYKAAEIGDTIKKDSGKTEIILIKKDTIIVFPCICGDVIVN